MGILLEERKSTTSIIGLVKFVLKRVFGLFYSHCPLFLLCLYGTIMIMENKLREIINIAVNAPSGHNYQPWSFGINSNVISVKILPENDRTIYNYKQRGSFIAIGAVVENIAIISGHYGYRASTNVFPRRESSDLVAEITITEGNVDTKRAELFEYIKQRKTNRKPYEKRILSSETKNELLSLPNDLTGVDVLLIDSEEKRKALGKAFSTNEWLVFNNRTLHNALFGHIVWTEKDEREKKSGLYIETFELPPPVKKLFRLFKYWNIAKVLGFIGFGNVVSKQNAVGYASASAIGGIYVPDESLKSYVSAGRVMQNFWLRATRLGLSVQIVVGILYLYERIKGDGRKNIFSQKQEKKILNAGEEIINTFGNLDKKLVLTFRVGIGAPPSAFSSKKEAIIE